ncbi:MAG: SUMF1/EgtB/PvdO family nonheme iron enzyme [Spirochaetaceae bacterium]|nr:SUMF1/EgtB/PvdO family nonheme iron enzyme [Spirochaetaceae bacterium]
MILKTDNCRKSLNMARAVFVALLVAFLFNTSCSNLFEPVISDPPQTAGTSNSGVAVVNFTGSFETSLPNGGAVPSELSALYRNDNSSGGTDARNAKPNLPTGVTYTVTAETVETASDGTNPAKTSSGTVNDSASTFTIPLVTGYKWKITVSANKTVTDQSTGESSTQTILSDTYTMPSVLSADGLNISHSFILKPLSSGTGSVTLSFTEPETSLYDDVAITAVSCSNTGGAGPSTWQGGLSSGTISLTGIASGNYYVTIDFKKDSELVFSTTQLIVVYPRLTTNTWVSGGGSLDPINNSGQFQVTAALVELFKRTQFFVGKPSDGSAGSDTSGDGSAAKPYATVGKALEKISQTGSGSVDYTIRISGTASENVVVSSTATNAITTSKARSITILGQRGLNASGVPQDILHGTGNDSVLTIATTVPITIRNLKITGGEAINGGGINIASGAKVTLANGAVVTGNKATYSGSGERNGGGGGVYNAGTLFMYESAVIGDKSVTAAPNSTSNSSNYAMYGGGLYNAVGASAYLGYSAINTTATLSGGIYNNYSNGGEAGAVYNKGTLKMNSGHISYNGSTGYVGGVTSEGSSAIFELSGGAISYNKTAPSSDSCYAGGVRIDGYGSQFTMKGGEISFNESNNGGGLSIIGSVVTFTGGIIKNNTATVKGSGIIFETGTLNMGGSAIVASGNDIWLNSGSDVATVTVYSSLTGDSPVATLTPGSYSRTSALVAAGTGVTLANETGKFAVTPNGSNDYVLDSQGKLKLGTLVTSSSVANMTFATGTSYNLVASSDFTNANLSTLFTNLSSSYASGASLDLSNTAITSLSVWVPSKVTSITLPSNVQSISSQEFQEANNLTEIKMPNDGNSYFSVENGVLYNSTKTELIKYPAAKSGAEFTLPNTVTQLRMQAFRGNKNLVRINGLNQITIFTSDGDSVFASCNKLEEADLSGLTCDTVPYCAFRNSSALKKIIFSSSVSVLDDWSFEYCTNLTEVHFKSSTPVDLAVNSNRKNFSNCSDNLKFYVPKGSKEAYLAATQDKGFANSSYNAYATSPEALAARVFEEDPEVLNMLYVQGAYFSGSSAITGSEVFISDRELIIPDLYVCDHEVTEKEWNTYMSNVPASTSLGDDYPVYDVTWYNAVAYCNALSEAKNLTLCYTINGNNVTYNSNADGYRLPTEAEWEYLARSGNLTNSGQTHYSGSDILGEVGWYEGNSSGGHPQVAKTKNPNALGIYDMSGNVWEMCWDWHADNISSSTGATGAESGTRRVNRGGSCENNNTGNNWCAVYKRGDVQMGVAGSKTGFRVVRSLSYSFHDSVTMLPAGTNGTAGTEDTSYALFGDWPQTIKASGVNIDTAQTLTRGSFTYYKGSDGNWYAKRSASPYPTNSNYTCSGGTTLVNGTEYYFKVEPIKWRVITEDYNSTGKKLLLAENILIAHRYNENGNDAYNVSGIRSYITGDFYNTAFTSALKAMIATTTVDNTDCDPTEDKVFLLSNAEATNSDSYGFASDGSTNDSLRVRKPTEFAMASGVETDQSDVNKGGNWWLRSPGSVNTKMLVTNTGSITQNYGWEPSVAGGLVPALCLNN